jgi:hypothetical protein
LLDVRQERRQGSSASSLNEFALACQPADARAMDGAALDSRLQDLRRRLRLETLANSAEKQDTENRIVGYLNGQGAEDLNFFGQHLPNVLRRLADFIPGVSPLPNIRRLLWCPVDLVRRVSRGLAVSAGRHKATFMHSACQQWAKLHQTIDHHARPELNADAGPQVQLCQQAGFCLCDAAGALSRRYETKLVIQVKKSCPPASNMRKRLSGSDIVLGLFGQERPSDEEIGAFDLAADGLLEGVPVRGEVWLHVGAHCKSPWKSTYHVLELDIRIPANSLVPREVRLRATHEYLNNWEMVAARAKDWRWCLVVYRVSWKNTPLGSFAPNILEVIAAEVSDGGLVVSRLVWQPWKKPRKAAATRAPKRRKVAGSGWEALADEREEEPGAPNDHRQQLREDEPVTHDGDAGGGDSGCCDGNSEAEEAADNFPSGGSSATDIGEWNQPGVDGDLPDIDFDHCERAESEGSVEGLIDEVIQASASAEPAPAEHPGAVEEPGFSPDEVLGGDELAAVESPVPLPGHQPELPVPAPAPLAADGPWPAYLDIKVNLPGGTLTWYYTAGKSGEFVAKCNRHPCSSGCRKNRVRHGSDKRPEQGRPLGYLVAWIMKGASIRVWHQLFPLAAAHRRGGHR